MPTPVRKTVSEATPDQRFRFAMEDWDRFEQSFRRSSKGNWWCRYEDKTVTVYLNPHDDLYHFSIADGDGVAFSEDGYETEEEGVAAAGEALGVGE